MAKDRTANLIDRLRRAVVAGGKSDLTDGQLLEDYLSRRDEGASAGVPTSLMSFTVKAATMLAAGKGTVAGVVPAKVATLTEGVMKTMLLTKLKVIMAGVLKVDPIV